MASTIHPLAVIDPSAVLGDGVVVGAFAVIGAEVEIGDGSEIGSGAQVHGPTRIGRENKIFPQTAIGFDPQDLKYAGERTRLEIGDRNHIREFSTFHRGTGKGGGLTTVGDDNLFMAYSHVAHDCHVGSRTVFGNAATLAGHVEVGDDAVINAFSAVHQFTRVGRHAYIGGFSVITQDALPYVKTVGHKPAYYGLNRIGLERKGFTKEQLTQLEAAFRILVESKLQLAVAIARLEAELAGEPAVDELIRFVKSSQRGLIRNLPGRGKSRGAA